LPQIPACPALKKFPPTRRARAFTLVEVMMAAAILVVGFIGMIQAVTIGSEMLATARRQTLAAQIIDHEIERLRLLPWDDPAGTNDLVGLAAGPTSVTIDSQFAAAISAAGLASGTTLVLSRSVSDVVTGSMREVVFTVTWTVRPSGVSTSRTYTRASSARFGKYGLNLTYQRS
jgi:Tfp pilus assembly protein PilV